LVVQPSQLPKIPAPLMQFTWGPLSAQVPGAQAKTLVGATHVPAPSHFPSSIDASTHSVPHVSPAQERLGHTGETAWHVP
jgi:hypothetical protein